MAHTSNPPDTAAVLTIQTVELTVYRTKEPGTEPAAKPETKGKAPAANAIGSPATRRLTLSDQSLPIRGSGLVQSK